MPALADTAYSSPQRNALHGTRSRKTNPLELAVRNRKIHALRCMIRQMRSQNLYRQRYMHHEHYMASNYFGRSPLQYCFRGRSSLMHTADNDELHVASQQKSHNDVHMRLGMNCLNVFIEEERRIEGDQGEWYIWRQLLQSDGRQSLVAKRIGAHQSLGWNFLHDASRFGQLEMVRIAVRRILHLADTASICVNRSGSMGGGTDGSGSQYTGGAARNRVLCRLNELLLQRNRYGSTPAHVAMANGHVHMACYLLLLHVGIITQLEDNPIVNRALTKLFVVRNDTRGHGLLRTSILKWFDDSAGDLLMSVLGMMVQDGQVSMSKICKRAISSQSNVLSDVASNFLRDHPSLCTRERTLVHNTTKQVPADWETLDYRKGTPINAIMLDIIEGKDMAEATLIHYIVSKPKDRCRPLLDRLCQMKQMRKQISESISKVCTWLDFGGNSPFYYATFSRSFQCLGLLISICNNEGGENHVRQSLMQKMRVQQVSTLDVLVKHCQEEGISMEVMTLRFVKSEEPIFNLVMRIAPHVP